MSTAEAAAKVKAAPQLVEASADADQRNLQDEFDEEVPPASGPETGWKDNNEADALSPDGAPDGGPPVVRTVSLGLFGSLCAARFAVKPSRGLTT